MTNVTTHCLSTKVVVGTFCIGLLCAGCTVRRVVFNEVVTLEQVNFIRVGETTIRDLSDHIGAPDEVTDSEFGVVALYYWSDTKSSGLDLGALARLFLPYAPTMTLTKTGITPEQLQVVFDPQWTVRAFGFSRRTTEDPVIWFWPF